MAGTPTLLSQETTGLARFMVTEVTTDMPARHDTFVLAFSILRVDVRAL